MPTSFDCPEPSVLKQFLNAESLPESALPWTRELLEQHLDQCQSCQKSLERLVAGQQSWEGAANLLAGIDAGSIDSSVETEALRRLMEAQKNQIPEALRETASAVDSPTPDPIRLDFLQPSDQPDSRGRLGQYEILDIVGRGGMGVVLKAYDTSLRRIVAIKVMASHLATSSVARKRFVREARAAAAVSHDHVVAIYGVEETWDPPFLVMQFISGKTLHERLTVEGSLSVNEVLRIGMQTAAGLAAAHSQGLVHRDIKPANILLENGVERVKITDFGLARTINDAGMTQTGIVAGTPQFMAPEQANGEPIDLRSDLFSLGSVLYMLCTGRPPFRATTVMGLLKRICEETPRPLRELNPEVPDWLDAIVMKLLAKRPADRYQSAKEVADLLEQWLAHTQRPLSIPRPNVPLATSSPTDAVQNTVTEVVAKSESEQRSQTFDATTEPIHRTSTGVWSDYSRTAAFAGNPQRVFDLATATLCAAGFKLIESCDSRLSFAGPGLVQVRQNVLTQASSIELAHRDGQLRLVAELGTMRKLHRNLMLIPLIFACFAACSWFLGFINYQVVSGNILIALASMLFFSILVGTSIFQGSKIVRRTLDTFFENLIHSEQFSRSVETLSPAPKPQWYEQLQRGWRETFPNRIYGTTALIWAAWVVFLIDSSRNFVPFAHWLATATLCLGVTLPTAILIFAWVQRARLGTWEGTVLPRGPGHFLLRPFMILFLFGGAYWSWQQLNCGVIAFDIDDREFTVSLRGPSLDYNQSFSADFHPMRVQAGTYSWGIRHRTDLIATGQIDVDRFQQSTIRFRSAYPVGQADILCLPGRWELKGSISGLGEVATKSAISSEIPSSPEVPEFIDVTENVIRVRSGRLTASLNTVTRQAEVRSADIPQFTDYRFRAYPPPNGLRGATWIDLIRRNSEIDADDVVAHGIFAADRNRLSFQLRPVSAPRPTWGTPYDNTLLMLDFERASEKVLLQGTWDVDPESKLGATENGADGAQQLIPVPDQMSFDKSSFEIRYFNRDQNAVRTGTFSLDTTHEPRQIILSTKPLNGVISISAARFRFDDNDHLTLNLSVDEKAPSGFEPLPGSNSVLIKLHRMKD